MSSDDFDNADQFVNDYEEAQQQESTEASKLQIKLNHLINNHKAPLKLYNDIVNLFNEYMPSNNFNRYARLKSRKSFIKAYESTYNVTHLRWKHKNVVLTDGAEVTIPDMTYSPETLMRRSLNWYWLQWTELEMPSVEWAMEARWVWWEQLAFLWKYTRDHAFEDVLTAFEVSGCKFWQCLGDTVAAQQLDPLDPQLWIKGG